MEEGVEGRLDGGSSGGAPSGTMMGKHFAVVATTIDIKYQT